MNVSMDIELTNAEKEIIRRRVRNFYRSEQIQALEVMDIGLILDEVERRTSYSTAILRQLLDVTAQYKDEMSVEDKLYLIQCCRDVLKLKKE